MTNLIANVSTLQSSLARRRESARLNQGLAKAEKEVSTGLRADLFRDLGQRASESIRLRQLVERNEGFVASNKLLVGKMEITSLAVGEMRTVADDFLALAVSGSTPGSAISSELQASARIALDQIIAQSNTVYQGTYLFAGIDYDKSPMQEWNRTNPATGYSPADVLANVISPPPASVSDVNAMVAELETVFDNTHPNAALHYESTFFAGTPQSAGQRVDARIDDGVTISYGVQANDLAFTDLVRGLSMLAAIDISQVNDLDTYSAYLDAAVQAVSSGSKKLLAAESKLGTMQGLAEGTIERQEDVVDIYKFRMVDLEEVDPYEAATRLTLLQTQLEASYAVTTRLSGLTLLNFF